MSRHDPDGQQFIADLEGLLRSAREAAAATLLTEASERSAEPASPPDRAPLSLYSCTTDQRGEAFRVVVQLLGRQALYEGAAKARDWKESPVQVGARAALAALHEWAQDLEFALDDALEAPTKQGPVAVVAVSVRAGSGEGLKPEGRLVGSAWIDDNPAAAGAGAALQAAAYGCSPVLGPRPPL